MSWEDETCEHVVGAVAVTPSDDGCHECLQIGGSWVHLRLCLACGHVGCCDQSPNRHATAHFRESAHPAVQSVEPGEDWRWCYADQLYADGPSGPS
ncbi:MAG TPA: UBP-type zinc finger domain-containing protein [Candidatus Limnocylindrales bacterium]|nr:UBP-type zinc finger domain-containing protein [Candidatus Limnocylindrales bacterium]